MKETEWVLEDQILNEINGLLKEEKLQMDQAGLREMVEGIPFCSNFMQQNHQGRLYCTQRAFSNFMYRFRKALPITCQEKGYAKPINGNQEYSKE